LKHFHENIQGWFCYDNLYASIIDLAPQDGAHFVEVGAWKGKSTAYMAVEIINSGKNIKFDTIDLWSGLGSAAYIDDKDVQEYTLYETFLKNIEPVKHVVNPIRMHSAEAASLYPTQSLDFVMIDAGHDYEDVKADLFAWLPKIKPGGLIAGDDFPDPGVQRAVREIIPLFTVMPLVGCWAAQIGPEPPKFNFK
jgi:hypothetical protein